MNDKGNCANIDSMQEILEKSGLKVTKPRLAVLRVLAEASFPLTSLSIWEELKKEGFNLSTIYRTLNSFSDAGLVKKEFNADKENVFSLVTHEDSHVLVCVKCHKKTPIEGCPYHEANEKIEEETGFSIFDHNTEIYGICPDCQKDK